jgi:hypothetical protein
MHCTLAEQLIPLFAGDDLPAGEAAALRAHLDACTACRQQAAEFAASRDWLRAYSTPLFSEAEMENLRDAVHREIAVIVRPRTWSDALLLNWTLRFKMGFAMAAAAILLAATIGLLRGRHSADRPAPLIGNADVKPPATPDASEPIAPAPKPRRPIRFGGRPRPETRQPVRPPSPEPPVALEPALVAANNPEMLRIELQTADPNIRIIWFAPKEPNSTIPNTNK